MAKPNLAYIPATIGDKVYSILPSDGVGDFDFTRGTVATRINAQGLIEEVASGENRLNYSLLDGEVVGCPHLLLEPSRANKLPYSLDYDNDTFFDKINSTITKESGIAPDGSNSAYKLKDTDDTSNTSHYFKQTNGYKAFIDYDAIKSASVFIKAGTKKQVQVRLSNAAGTFSYVMGNFDLETETILTGASFNAENVAYDLQNYGNGWYRCIVIGSWTESNVSHSRIEVFTADTSLASLPNIHNYQGNGLGTLFVWGEMIEEGSYATSYIPTNGSPTTRAAETCDGSGNAATFNDSEGVLMAEISALDNDSENKFISISNGSNTETLRIAYISGTDIRLETSMTSGTNFQKDIEINLSDNNKVCFQYKSNEYKVFVNGFSYSVTQRLTTPTGLNELSFHRGDGGRNFYGKTKQLQYFDSALSDTELEQLTSWDSFRAMAQAQQYSIQ
jgi:hypothetical protein